MASPYVHRPTAITAGTPQLRSFERAYPTIRRPHITELAIYNKSSMTATLVINGDSNKRLQAGPGDYVPHSVEGEEILFYTVDVDSGVSSGTDIEVYEYGGLHDGV